MGRQSADSAEPDDEVTAMSATGAGRHRLTLNRPSLDDQGSFGRAARAAPLSAVSGVLDQPHGGRRLPHLKVFGGSPGAVSRTTGPLLEA